MPQLAFDEGFKWIVSSAVQLFLGISASILAWRLGRDSSAKANQELKVKLYERRYSIYLAFKAFIHDCLIQDFPQSIAIRSFTDGSTVMTDVNALRAWFFRQDQGDLMKYFAPYLGLLCLNLRRSALSPAVAHLVLVSFIQRRAILKGK